MHEKDAVFSYSTSKVKTDLRIRPLLTVVFIFWTRCSTLACKHELFGEIQTEHFRFESIIFAICSELHVYL